MTLDCHIPFPVRRDVGVMLCDEEWMCRLEQVSAIFFIYGSDISGYEMSAVVCDAKFIARANQFHPLRFQFANVVLSMLRCMPP